MIDNKKILPLVFLNKGCLSQFGCSEFFSTKNSKPERDMQRFVSTTFSPFSRKTHKMKLHSIDLIARPAAANGYHQGLNKSIPELKNIFTVSTALCLASPLLFYECAPTLSKLLWWLLVVNPQPPSHEA